MKKTIFAVAAVLLVTMAAACCKKDNVPKIKTETPMQTTIEEGIIVDSVRRGVLPDYGIEIGQKLYFTRNGRITKLGCKMPETSPGWQNYDVSLWDFNTGAKIAGVKVPVTDINQFAYVTISPVTVTANTRYVVSVNNTQSANYRRFYTYVKRSNIPDDNPIYPFTAGSAVYEASVYKNPATAPAYPSTLPSGLNAYWQAYIRGVADVTFEYEE